MKKDDRSELRDFPERRMFHRLNQTCLLDLWMVENLGKRKHRPKQGAVLVERRLPLLAGSVKEDPLEILR